jgi:hypothetical protein
VVAKLCPDITFWKRDMVKGIKIKTSWLLNITIHLVEFRKARIHYMKRWRESIYALFHGWND